MPWKPFTMKYSKETQEVIIKFFKYFEGEGKRGRPFYSFATPKKRIMHALQICKRTLSRILTNSQEGTDSKVTSRIRKEKLDYFDQHLVRNVIRGFFTRNEYISTRKLKKVLHDEHGMDVSKYVILKLLHKFGYKYGKQEKFNRTSGLGAT